MKTSRLFLMITLLVAGSFCMEMLAQEAIRAIVKKCEKMENINLNVAKEKSKDTKKVIMTATHVRIMNDEKMDKDVLANLKKEILAAFEKEKDEADKETVQMENGKCISMLLNFGKNGYSYSEDKNGNIMLSAIEYFEEKPKK